MLKFPSINSFRHAVASVKRAYDYAGQPYPTIRYEGRVKLHGTNAGIHISADGTLTPQSRERVLSINSDNAGFARWVKDNEVGIRAWAAHLFEGFIGEGGCECPGMTVYGEWIGPGIQKNVALTQLPARQFVAFSVAYDDTIVYHEDGSSDAVFYPLGVPGFKIETGVHNFHAASDAAVVIVDIDFTRPDDAVKALEDATTAFENECPYGKLFGISGIGEGLVWAPTVMDSIKIEGVIPENKQSRLWFKSKGEKHGNKGTSNVVKVAVTAEKIDDFNALVAQLLPDWRLEQGFGQLPTDSSAQPTRAQTGDFLKWVCSDVYKEELDTVVASEFEWEVVVKEISKRARTWFLARAV